MTDDTREPNPDDLEPESPELDFDEDDIDDTIPVFDRPGDVEDEILPPVPHPINWDLLTAEDAEHEWLTLNEWVHWLRKTYGLPASIVPPFWHRHRELVWELSALHLHWLGAFDPEQTGSAPIGWHKDFADARERLRDWISVNGTKLDRDRPTRQTIWPGEETDVETSEAFIENREEDFVEFVIQDVARRAALEAIARDERP